MKNVYEMNLSEILDKYNTSDRFRVTMYKTVSNVFGFNLNEFINLYNRLIINNPCKNVISNKDIQEMGNILEKIKKDYGIEYYKVLTEKLTYNSDIINIMIAYDFDKRLYNIICSNTGRIENKHLKRKDIYKPDIDSLIELYYLFVNKQISISGIGEKRFKQWAKLMNDLERDYNIDWKERGYYLSNLKECPFDNTACSKICSTNCNTYKEHNIFNVKITRG